MRRYGPISASVPSGALRKTALTRRLAHPRLREEQCNVTLCQARTIRGDTPRVTCLRVGGSQLITWTVLQPRHPATEPVARPRQPCLAPRLVHGTSQGSWAPFFSDMKVGHNGETAMSAMLVLVVLVPMLVDLCFDRPGAGSALLSNRSVTIGERCAVLYIQHQPLRSPLLLLVLAILVPAAGKPEPGGIVRSGTFQRCEAEPEHRPLTSLFSQQIGLTLYEDVLAGQVFPESLAVIQKGTSYCDPLQGNVMMGWQEMIPRVTFAWAECQIFLRQQSTGSGPDSNSKSGPDGEKQSLTSPVPAVLAAAWGVVCGGPEACARPQTNGRKLTRSASSTDDSSESLQGMDGSSTQAPSAVEPLKSLAVRGSLSELLCLYRGSLSPPLCLYRGSLSPPLCLYRGSLSPPLCLYRGSLSAPLCLYRGSLSELLCLYRGSLSPPLCLYRGSLSPPLCLYRGSLSAPLCLYRGSLSELLCLYRGSLSPPLCLYRGSLSPPLCRGSVSPLLPACTFLHQSFMCRQLVTMLREVVAQRGRAAEVVAQRGRAAEVVAQRGRAAEVVAQRGRAAEVVAQKGRAAEVVARSVRGPERSHCRGRGPERSHCRGHAAEVLGQRGHGTEGRAAEVVGQRGHGAERSHCRGCGSERSQRREVAAQARHTGLADVVLYFMSTLQSLQDNRNHG
ncbi:hypothetical protein P4O66_002292 [Electrophorus voltai]|uniref:Uncharacterized protein n=1 Tax=Electrophorus voltai TaxID=2609070 RepID=A0AAD9DP45_9TELE|nr:hypothetical protein P4O66_002292 [Electrophorus voltai]